METRLSAVPARTRTAFALGLVWVTFGSAFVALKIGVTSVPPFLFSGSRFFLVGLVLLGWSVLRARGRLKLTRRDVLISAATGAALIFAGQGAASWASQYLAPGIVAVLAATTPLWIVLISFAVLRVRPGPVTLAGLGAGFAGVVYLSWPAGGGVLLGPALVATVGSFCWAVGSLLAGRSEIARRPLLMTSMQMLAGGALQIVLGLALGEAGALHLAQMEAALPAFLYLVAVPALIGFPVFTWLLASTPAHVANTQSYTAPVVSLGLGWLLLSEPLTARTLTAVGVILAGVALIVATRRPAAKPANPEAQQEPAGLEAA